VTETNLTFLQTISRHWREGVIVLGLSLVALGLAVLFRSDSSSEIEIIPAQKPSRLVVDIEGAVINPGVYELKSGSRINDLLIACGGLSQEADRDWVAKNLNLASPVIDGAKIYIPQAGEEGAVVGAAAAGLVNINQADASLLETLPGIGPSFAQKIIDYRQANQGFKSVEELMAVPGIGKKTYDRLRDEVTVF